MIYAYLNTNNAEEAKEVSLALGGDGEVEHIDHEAWNIDVGDKIINKLKENGYIEMEVNDLQLGAEWGHNGA